MDANSPDSDHKVPMLKRADLDLHLLPDELCSAGYMCKNVYKSNIKLVFGDI